jgi:hypothetical protein
VIPLPALPIEEMGILGEGNSSFGARMKSSKGRKTYSVYDTLIRDSSEQVRMRKISAQKKLRENKSGPICMEEHQEEKGLAVLRAGDLQLTEPNNGELFSFNNRLV